MVGSTELIRQLDYRKEIRVLTFRALASVNKTKHSLNLKHIDLFQLHCNIVPVYTKLPPFTHQNQNANHATCNSNYGECCWTR